MIPTRRTALVVAAIAALAVALQSAWTLAVVLVGLLAGALVADGVYARGRSTQLERPESRTIARAVPVPFRARATTSGPGSVRLRQPFPPELRLDRAEAAGERRVTLDTTLEGVHRGRHELPAASIRVWGPLGLATSDARCGGRLEVTVMPDLPRARRMAEARARGRLADAGRLMSRLGIGTEFETVRDYSPDDDVRQINWTATARSGRAMSNQYRIDENRDLICLVDAGRLMRAPIGSQTRLDVALDALSVLVVAAEQAGDRVGAVAFADEVLRSLPARRRGAEAVVRAVFDLEPTDRESDYERAFASVAGSKRALVVLFTDLMDEAATRSLTSALPVLARSHSVMAVSCTDTDLVERARTPPRGVDDALRQSVAVGLLEATSRSVELIRRMGALVVEAPCAVLGSACVAGYVTLKRRARV